MEVRQLLDNVLAGRTVESQEGFNQILSEKIQQKQDQAKINLASKIMQGGE